MTSSRSSKVTTLALLAFVVVGTAVPAVAVTVDETTFNGSAYGEDASAEVGEQISASFTLSELYLEPNWDPWTLRAQTQLTSVTWTVTFINAQGEEFDTRSYDGQSLNGNDGVNITTERDIDKVRVEFTGTVPEVDEYTYPEEETFVVAKLVQTRGEQGSQTDIGTWEAHHYTTGEGDGAGSQEARTAIEEARSAIRDAEDGGANPSGANDTLQTAIEFYELGQFDQAVTKAETAEEQANQAASSSQTTQLLMYAGIAVLVLALLGGGFWYYQQQQDDYDKLG